MAARGLVTRDLGDPGMVNSNSFIGDEFPVANRPVNKSMLSFDEVIIDFMIEQDIPGGSVALSKNGTLLYCQGYGSAGVGRKVQPDALFRIASISKFLTAVGIMKLIEDGRMSMEDKVFGSQGILSEYSPTEKGDSRIVNITVRHLLNHSAGWDRDRAGDPVFWKVGKHMNVPEPIPPRVLIRYMMARKLQFTPGRRHAYSNLGYTILGQVIARVSGQSYEAFMLNLLKTVEIERMRIGRTRKEELQPDEVEYFHNCRPWLVKSIFPEGGRVPPQYGRWTVEKTDAHGGWIATTADLVKFCHALEQGLNGNKIISPEMFKLMLEKPSFEGIDAEEWYGCGLDIRDCGTTWGHSGQMEGTSGVLTRHRSGYTWALFFNSWAKDVDLDGLLSYAVSLTSGVPEEPIFSCVLSESIITADHCQLIKIMLPASDFWPFYNEAKQQGLEIKWLHACSFRESVYFNTIFLKNQCNSPTTVYTGLTKESCQTYIESLVGLVPFHIESYVEDSELRFAILLSPTKIERCVAHCDLTVTQHRKNMPVMFKNGYNLTVQCLTEFKGRLHVTALYQKVLNGECVAEFDLKPDHYQFEFHRQSRQGGTLSYVRAYHVKRQPRFSVIWTNQSTELSGTRHHVSKYGFLYELGEAAKKNFFAQCISSYFNEGVLNFVASWKR